MDYRKPAADAPNSTVRAILRKATDDETDMSH